MRRKGSIPDRPRGLASGLVSGLLVAAAGIAACSDAVARPKPAALAPTPATAPPASRQAVAPAEVVAGLGPGGAVGALERAPSLRRFFQALAELESETSHDDVRIVQFGDSHTAADVQSAASRHALQARFGDGGRGFVALGRPWRNYLVEGVRVGMSSEWSPEKAKLGPHPTGDGIYGLAGIGLVTRSRGARAWSDIAAKTARAEVAYLEQPGGGSFEVLVDGQRIVRVATRGERTTSAFRAFDVSEASPHQLEVRTVGDGEVRVFGLALARAQRGVVYDALGINGARITQPLAWNEQHWAEQLRHRAPSLVILAYGTNESVDEAMPAQTYERQLVDLLGRLARAVPGASCLLLGPPDRAIDTREAGWSTAPKILEIIQSQRRVAEAAGCAFYDQLAAMGGEGAIAAWAAESPPRAQKDRVHLTKEGYAQLGSAFASDLMRAYAGWRRENGMPPSTAPAIAPGPAPAPIPTQPADGDTEL